jgi:hypothetical protein
MGMKPINEDGGECWRMWYHTRREHLLRLSEPPPQNLCADCSLAKRRRCTVDKGKCLFLRAECGHRPVKIWQQRKAGLRQTILRLAPF